MEAAMAAHVREAFTMTGIGAAGIACAILTALFFAAVFDKAF